MTSIRKIVIFLVFVFCLQISAQNAQKKAQKLAAKMTKVLELNKEDSKAVYKIQFNRFKEGAKIRKEFKDQPEIKKEKLKKVGSKVFNDLKKLLGKERLKQWRTYKSKNQ